MKHRQQGTLSQLCFHVTAPPLDFVLLATLKLSYNYIEYLTANHHYSLHFNNQYQQSLRSNYLGYSYCIECFNHHNAIIQHLVPSTLIFSSSSELNNALVKVHPQEPKQGPLSQSITKSDLSKTAVRLISIQTKYGVATSQCFSLTRPLNRALVTSNKALPYIMKEKQE